MTTTMQPSRRRREQIKRLAWLTEAQVVIGWIVILLVVALVGAIYLNQASRIASVGRRVQLLQNQLDNLKRENATVSRQIAEAQSLERLRQEAIRLGFVPSRPEDLEYIIVPDYPADAADSALSSTDAESNESLEAESSNPESMAEAIWLRLKAGLGDLIQGEASEQ